MTGDGDPNDAGGGEGPMEGPPGGPLPVPMSPGGEEDEVAPPSPPVPTTDPGVPDVADLRQFLRDTGVDFHESVRYMTSLQNTLRAQLLSGSATAQLSLGGTEVSSPAPGGGGVARIDVTEGLVVPQAESDDETVYLPVGDDVGAL